MYSNYFLSCIQRYCDHFLHAVSDHTNLRSVEVTGMRARVGLFSSLVSTNFFSKLEKLVLHIEMASSTLERLHFDLSLAVIASIGKMRHLSLNGLAKVDTTGLAKLAICCPKLETLISDCQLTNDQQVNPSQICFYTFEVDFSVKFRRIFKGN
jgi:ABC-type transporter Mla MlaB component